MHAWDEKTAEALAELESNPPPILYHYTNARGLIGILRDQVVWAGDVEHMNDELELKYARDVAARVAESLFGTAQTDAGRAFLGSLASKADPLITFQNYFVASFTQNADQLSQWRAYADNGLGFAIGFGTLSGFACAPAAYDFLNYFRARPRRVLYNAAQQDALLAPAIREALDAADAGLPNASDLAHRVSMATIELLLTLKNPAFTEEDEWRLVAPTGPEGPSPLHFEPSRFGISPFMRLAYYGDEALKDRFVTAKPRKLPIVHIVAGPRVPDTHALYYVTEEAGYFARCEALDEAKPGEAVFLSKSTASYR